MDHIIRAGAALIALVALSGALGGCESVSRLAAPAAPARIEAFHSGEAGIFANAYLVETRSAVVLIDATLLESTSRALRERIAATGKPLKAVLLTHGHPDHYNGVTNVLGGAAVPVLATAGANQVIREQDAAKEKQWAPVFKSEWPRKRTFPTRTIADGEAFEVDGVRFTVHDLGRGESDSDAYWIMDDGRRRVAFIGDVVLHRMHAYVSDGHTGAWLSNIARLKETLRDVERLYPGHGEAAGLEMLDWQRDYLLAYRAAVKALAQGRPSLTEEQKNELAARMHEHFASAKLAFLIPLGADAVAAELALE